MHRARVRLGVVDWHLLIVLLRVFHEHVFVVVVLLDICEIRVLVEYIHYELAHHTHTAVLVDCADECLERVLEDARALHHARGARVTRGHDQVSQVHFARDLAQRIPVHQFDFLLGDLALLRERKHIQ